MFLGQETGQEPQPVVSLGCQVQAQGGRVAGLVAALVRPGQEKRQKQVFNPEGSTLTLSGLAHPFLGSAD